MKLLYFVGLLICWVIVICTIPFIVIGGIADWIAQKFMRLGDKCSENGF